MSAKVAEAPEVTKMTLAVSPANTPVSVPKLPMVATTPPSYVLSLAATPVSVSDFGVIFAVVVVGLPAKL
ncbi:hypothetical protein LINBF2_13010 [Limnohabitans sp. INBF002]|nr:hypothetical protein LINBF2_13010 [Limnohabitans sp. INBF002]